LNWIAFISCIAALIETEKERLGGGLSVPTEEVAAALLALFDGYVLQKVIDPRHFPSDALGRLLVLVIARANPWEGRTGAEASPPR